MIKVVLIEDEIPAKKKLKSYLAKLDSTIEIVKETDTVQDTLAFLQTQPQIDLIFSDIELRDGNVFEAYQQIHPDCPIIFATAYDQFWMNAFETSGIEYLLKPYTFNRFEKAWNKYLGLTNKVSDSQNELFNRLDAYYQAKFETKTTYKEHLPVKSNSGTYFLKVEDIVYLQSDYGVVFAFDTTNKKHLLNQTSLTAVQALIDPEKFFKINRSEVVNRRHIEKISRYSKNSVAIHTKSEVLKTSQSSTAGFNAWMGV